ncbi:MAG: methyltransferase domain-containing protein [Pseudomonadales bacterium]|nr:methyltransferase domain-containing protein [Pseudomonadales bacterium]MCP5183998.1 methyltransferase domain-containing protein [Pseudomonadales bacterium]
MTSPRKAAAQPLLQAVADGAFFFRRFLDDPTGVASIVPSSRYLSAAMFDGLTLAGDHCLVEFGPGTGAFTLEVERRRQAGVNLRYLGIERDPALHRRLCQRFPELDFQLGDVADVHRFVQARGLGTVHCILSGLPLVLFSERQLDDIFTAVTRVLHPDGEFRTFTYVNSYPTPGSVRLRRRLRKTFAGFSVSAPVLRNLPPALVMCCTAPRQDRPANAP